MTANEKMPSYNPVTGEILDPQEETGQAGTPEPTVPAQVVKGSELAALPENLSELAAFFAEPEPTPQEVVRWIAGTSEMDDSDPEDTMRSIMARILSATTAEDILSGHKVTHAQDILNMPIKVDSVKWQKSRMNDGSACYAVITAESLEGEQKLTITCGGRNVMTQLLAFQVHQLYPVRCVIRPSSKPTEAGYYPLWLEPA